MHAAAPTSLSPVVLLRLVRRLLAVLLGGLALGLVSVPAAAQSCFVGKVDDISFGITSPDANTDTFNNLVYTCQSNASPTYFRVCMYIPEGSPLSGINPRRMTNYNGAAMKYDLYSDAARTRVIGPPPTGGGFPVYSFTALAPAGFVKVQNTATIYARVPAGQSLPATSGFQSQIGGAILYWAWSNSGMPPDCTSGSGGADSTTFYQGVTADVDNSCRITLATDLDFGNAGALTANRDQTSTIMVRCPTGTNWRLGLNNGSNPNGNVRRMRNATGNYVIYELYRDGGRSQRWGNTPGTDTANGTGQGEASPVTQTVYGRVPAQPAAPSGSYTDTVTVTLTY